MALLTQVSQAKRIEAHIMFTLSAHIITTFDVNITKITIVIL